MKKIHSTISSRKNLLLFLFLGIFICVLSTIPLFARDVLVRESDKLCLYFLDLSVDETATDKSGDSTILIAPTGEVMLIDSGHPQSGHQVLAALKALNVDHINYYVASHPHIDHIGSFPEIAAALPIGKVYRSSLVYDSSYYHAFVNTIKARDIAVEILSEGDSFNFGSEISVKVFNPQEPIIYPNNYPKSSTQFVNNQSLALQLSYGSSTAWFGGDLYMVQERALSDKYGDTLQTDVVKANHHGGGTSNTLRWIKTLQPKIVVAMHDRLDSMAVYNNYKKQGAQYHLTALVGNVRVVMDDSKGYTVTTTKDSWM